MSTEVRGTETAGVGGWQQAEQIKQWKEYIEWEKSNPQRLDGPAVAQRVNLAYEQALMPLMHCPEVRTMQLLVQCADPGSIQEPPQQGLKIRCNISMQACCGI